MNDFQALDQAIELLETPHLIWSSDFEAIRHHLHQILVQESKSYGPYEATFDLAKELIDGYHNDITIG